MGEFVAKVHTRLKDGVPDNSGNSLVNTLHQLGFNQVLTAHTGKLIEVTLAASTKKDATKQIEEMSSTFFANPVIEEATTESIDRIPATKPQGSRRRKPKAE